MSIIFSLQSSKRFLKNCVHVCNIYSMRSDRGAFGLVCSHILTKEIKFSSIVYPEIIKYSISLRTVTVLVPIETDKHY